VPASNRKPPIWHKNVAATATAIIAPLSNCEHLTGKYALGRCEWKLPKSGRAADFSEAV